MRQITARVKRYPFATFVVLAYALAWWPVLVSPGTLFPYGPFLAALIVLAVTAGRAGVADLLRQMGRWRVGLGWYAVAFGLPLALGLLAVMLTGLLGAPAPTRARLPDWSFLTATVLPLLALGGLWEEPGWRGYAQPRLERDRSALWSALLLGVIWGPWHLPLMLAGRVPWSDLVFIPAACVVCAWLYNSTGRSVLIVMTLHWAMNVSGILGRRLVADSDLPLRGWFSAGVWCTAALAVVLLAGRARLTRPKAVGRDGDGALARGAAPAVTAGR